MTSIFIVEDELSLLNLYRMVLEAFGFDVIDMAKNGEEAVQKFKSFSKKPDLIIMDYRMPIKNGIEATKEILQIKSDIKVVFASADLTVENYARSIGAMSFKKKPFNNENLINNIKKALNITIN